MLGEESMYPMDWLAIAERDLRRRAGDWMTTIMELPDFFCSKPWKSP